MKVTWPQVAVVGIIVAALVGITISGKDTNGIILIGGAILAGLGLVAGKTEQVAKQTNGNQTAMLDLVAQQSAMLERLAHRMGDMQPPATADLTVEAVRPFSPAERGD